MALIIGLGLFVLGVLTAVLSSVVVGEIKAWSPLIVHSLIKSAVKRLPENLRDRFTEEWQSHVNEVPGQIGKLVVAANFSIAAYNVTLNDRRKQADLELLAVFDEVKSASTAILNLIENDPTVASRVGLNPDVTDFRSHVSALGAMRQRLAAHIAASSASTRISLVNLLHGLIDSFRRRKYRSEVFQLAKEITEASADIVKRVVEITKSPAKLRAVSG